MKILIQDEHGVRELEEGYASEEELQTFLRDHAELIPVDEIELGTPPLLCIGWEVSVASGSEDLLYVDETGLLTVVETKLAKNREARRAVVGQILEYASYLCSWSASDIEKQAQRFFASEACPAEYRGLSLESALGLFLEKREWPGGAGFIYEDFLSALSTYLERGDIRLVIAIDEPPDPLLRIVEFVNRFSERFEMYLIQLKRFHDKGTQRNIFVPALFGRVAAARKPPDDWDWGKYRARLGWAERDVQRAQAWLSRLERIAEAWGYETRFHQGWVDVRCYGRERFGVQVTKQAGLELFFWARQMPKGKLPDGLAIRQTKEMLFLSGALESLGDAELTRLCEATLTPHEREPQ
jgi:hypothetical protein